MSGKITDNLGRSSGLIKEASGGGGGTSISDADNNTKIQVEESSDENIIRFDTGGTEVMKIDANGIISKPLQPAFNVSPNPSSTQENIAFNSYVDITHGGTERFDQNSDFASSTFTAPVTGKYLLVSRVQVDTVTQSYDYYASSINTSNKRYFGWIWDTNEFSSDQNYTGFVDCVIADMDASDTATAQIVISTTGSGSSASDISFNSYFMGCLLV